MVPGITAHRSVVLVRAHAVPVTMYGQFGHCALDPQRPLSRPPTT